MAQRLELLYVVVPYWTKSSKSIKRLIYLLNLGFHNMEKWVVMYIDGDDGYFLAKQMRETKKCR